MKVIKFISRVIIGMVFIFSGFVKAVDPFGSAYKFGDYFEAFHINFLGSIALPLAIILSSAEFIIGICLLFGISIKQVAWALLVFMLFFTALTFILALTNPVTDCGCFGDAIILTNWQTFYKNIILLPFVLVIFLWRNKYRLLYKPKTEWAITAFFTLFIVIFSVYCIKHLPVIDFRPYNIGTYIPEKMEIPEDAPRDVYETKIFYEKNGETKEFQLENLPDSTWKFVRTENKLVKQGYVAPVHDFTIDDLETGEDIADIVLSDNNYYFVLIAYDLDKYKIKNQPEINELAGFCREKGYNFICLTASGSETIKQFKEKNGINYPFYNTDEITLKTIVRSNPGLILLKEGVIIGKWHNNDIPEIKKLDKNILAFTINKSTDANENKIAVIYLLLLVLIILAFNLLIQKKPLIFKDPKN